MPASGPGEPERARRQTWSAETYKANAGFVADLGAGVLDWLAPQRDERILDLGCGDGRLTAKIAESGAVVVGADASAPLLAAARKLGIETHRVDGHQLHFEREFDAVFSNAALHWMTEPAQVASGVSRALKPGGRFVGEFGGFGNVAAVVTAMCAVYDAMEGAKTLGDRNVAHPWYFPKPDEYSAVLADAGLKVTRVSHFARPTPLPTGIRGWLETMRAPFFDGFGPRREEAYARVEAALSSSLRDESGGWWADYVRLRFEAFLT